MTYYSVSAFINFFVSLILGLFVLYKNPKDKLNRALFFFCFAISFWSFFYFLWQISNSEHAALILTRLLMLGAIWVPIAYLRVVIIFFEIEKEKRIFLRINYFFAIFFSCLLATPLMVSSVKPVLEFKFWPQPGLLYLPFLFMFIAVNVYAFILSYSFLRKETSAKRRAQIKYMLFGMALAVAGGSTNYFLWYGIMIKPYGNALAVSFVIFTVYAMIKHDLFNFRVITAQLLSLGILVVSIFEVFTAKNTQQFFLQVVIFLVLLIFSVWLIRSMENELKREDQLRIVNEQLRKLDEAKSVFISIASHQLRTPLTISNGFLSLIKEGNYGPVPDNLKEPFAKINAANVRLLHLVEDLLNISRIESGRMVFEFAPANIENMVKEIVDSFELPAKEKKLKLSLSLPKKHLPLVYIDKGKISEAISNLVDNAIKYTQEGGVAVKGELHGSCVRIIVSDTGIGVKKDDQDIVFDKFSRGSDQKRLTSTGSGLGLFFGTKVVEANKGKMWVESEGEGKGSTFIIEIPAVDGTCDVNCESEE